MATYIYDPDKNSIIFGSNRITGWADGEYITAEMETDTVSDVSGTDGDVVISKTSDRRCTVVIKTHQGSPVNAQLSQILSDVEQQGSAAGIRPFAIKDNSTAASAQKELVYGAESWIMGWPAMSRDRSAKSLEWRIRIAKCERFEPGA